VERELAAVPLAAGTPLLLDLGGLTFVDSAGLRAVLRIYGRCLKHRHELRILPAPPSVQRVFALTRAADVLPFCAETAPHSEAALAAA
jgi:anti-anti-sigma factor